MNTKVCTNSSCGAHGHLIYTVAMRCLFCRWDLKVSQRNDDWTGTRKAASDGSDVREYASLADSS